ncbi:unnamed protein product [Polarella glacialis]|uniref:Cytochrome P450 n=1 Tax=Polarella glacialis TaxID=89957 RepID=A0A813DUF6_POLGL|nr:unnamed protein product [Polarella glacialis]
MNLHLNNYASMAASWKTGETPSMWQRVTAIAVTGTLIVLNDMQNTEAFLAFSRSTCRTLLPFGRGFIDGTGYQHVINSITDPNMPRMFQMGANGGTEACFDPSMVIFQSSGTPEHSQSRRLWDDAVMSSMHLGDLPDLGNTSARGWMRRMRDRVGWKLPTEDEVGALIVPLLLERIWGKKPTAKEAETVAGYLSVGKVCIFGGMADSIPFLPSMIAAVRTAHVDFARDSPTADKLVKLLEEPGFAAVQKLYQSRGRPIRDVAVQGLADATMFAGVLGTTDMTFKCVKYTWQDPKHLRLFREKPTEYIWELMRVQAAVQGVSSVSTKARDDHMAGEEVHFPAGTPVAYSVSIANRDPIMFSKPSDMDFQRPWSEMGEMLSWNGRLKDVIARNYTGAPRFCPGHDLSVKLAAHVCAHLTRNL